MAIDYTDKQNKRAVGQEILITEEAHVIGTVGAFTPALATVKLIEIPLKEEPSSVIVTGPGGAPLYTEITDPLPTASGQFFVDYVRGYLTFHPDDENLDVVVTYWGRGSEVDAVDINEVQTPVKTVINLDGTIKLSPAAEPPVDGTVQYSASGQFEGYKQGAWVDLAPDTGDLTETVSSVLDITGGTDAVIGTGTTIEVKQASTTQDGFLSSTDWNTFNDKQESLGFTPEDVANKSTNTALGTSDTLYPSQNAVKTYVDTGLSGKEYALWFTPEDVANKSTNESLGTSDVLYPSQKAVKTYVDAVAQGLIPKRPCRYATTADLDALYDNGVSGVGATLTANNDGAFSIDGDTAGAPIVGQRILVKDQTNLEENGIYVVSDTGDISSPFILERAADFDNSPSGEVEEGDYVFIEDGAANEHTSWVLVVTPSGSSVVIGTTPLEFIQFGVGGGSGGVGETIIVTTTPYTAADKQNIFVDASLGAMVVDLPPIASSLNKVYTIKKIDTSAFTVTIDPSGSELIDGALTHVISVPYESYTVICDGVRWNIV